MKHAYRLTPTVMQRLAAMLDRPEPPSEGELWDTERLYGHGRLLGELTEKAPAHVRRVDLKARLKSNARALQSAYHCIVAALQAGRAISPAAEWIVDNFHVVSEQLSDAPLRLTPRIWRELPAATRLDDAALPRVYVLATEYLQRTLWEFKPESLQRMLDGYQQRDPLTMRELWALYPILRIALIEELRRVAVRVEDGLNARAAADAIADSLMRDVATGGERPLEPPAWLENPLPPPFTVQLIHRLHTIGERGRPMLDALAASLCGQGTSVDECIQRQHARRSANNLAARNIITSLRVLASYDWRSMFEKTSLVERLLRERPDYVACDRRTRDRYRHSIEELARGTDQHEVEITRRALALVGRAPADGMQADLGAWLIGPCRTDLEEALGCPVSVGQRLRRTAIRNARALYPGGIVLLTLALVLWVVRTAAVPGTSPALLWLVAALAAFPASELATGVLNRIWLRAFPPRHLPRLALESGLDAQHRTLVVVPTMLRSPECVAEACRQLHVHALANPDPQVFFALLSDWTDSPTEHRDGDEEILALARDGIAALNEGAGDAGATRRFFLLHRRRQWSQTEGCYTGWERKRGKLAELNRLLLGTGPTSFMPDASGALPYPHDIHYVLTVDADTRLPLGCVRDLVGVAAHPLNRPVFDPAQRRVVGGYGVLQPRITPLLPATDERSLYREIVTSGSGIDPYAAAVSDLYQDVFGEGLFTGKGLYDLAAWEAAMDGRVPPESVLSHDLFEGVFVRCGLVSDFEIFEDFPSNSEVAAARSHRWMRGDWQLLPWILGRHGPLPPMARWKMLDNLRRALLAPASMALLIAAFVAPSLSAAVCAAIVLAPHIWPAVASAIERLLAAPAARSRRMHLYRMAADFAADLARTAVWLALLAQNSWLALDAMGRALYRLGVSRRHLLEWVTAAQLKAAGATRLESFVWPLKGASIVVVTAAALLVAFNPAGLRAFAPLLVLWWLSPLLAQWLSRPLERPRSSDSVPRAVDRELRGTARLTWTFFETFVTAEDNYLPPDNFQEEPVPVIAHRSSPTNFGMYLLSTVAARDFGWLGLQEMSARLTATFATLQRLQRFRGHFLNWYDTRTLSPLLPRYVSTVDSGNLAGHLLALGQACLEFRDGPLLSPRAFGAPLDGLWLAWQALNPAAPGEQPAGSPRSDHRTLMVAALARFEERLGAGAPTLGEARQKLQWASNTLGELLDASTGRVPANALRALSLARRDVDSNLADLRLVLHGDTAQAAAVAALPADATLGAIAAAAQGRPGAAASPSSVLPLARSLEDIAGQCSQFVAAMSFDFLYDRRRGLFSIGYRIDEGALDEGYYDLLASEARLASLVAIAKGEAPRSHWFRLGRRLTGGPARPVLASWSGSMFEYLMPALVMQEPRYSLLDQTNRRVVRQQIRYGMRHDLPWGISESAYNVRDREYTYQYSGFGVPALGLKRGLSSDYVVAPYATALAAMYQPVEAAINLRELALAGARGTYGYYEALDYTPPRVPEDQAAAVVRAHMAHHQGMSLVALDNALHDFIMQARFHADPRIAAADLLLQERRLRFVEAPAFVEANVPASHTVDEPPDLTRVVEGVNAPTPVTHLLSNRRYVVMLTDSGAGYSSCRDRRVTRWRPDATADCWGSFIYVREPDEHRVWSAGFQPTAALPDEYEAQFSEECGVISRRDGSIRTTMTVVVAADDEGELRQVTLHNDGTRSRDIELTSYAEIVLAPQQADVAHPAFSNLFVQTEFVAEYGALLASRRPRSSRESTAWAAHVVADTGTTRRRPQYETDRSRFIGRGRSVRHPQAMDEGRVLGNTAGNVLDPIFSLRTTVTVPPRGRTRVTFATFVGRSRDEVLALVARYRNPALFEHMLQSAWTFARTELHYLASNLGEAQLFQTLASHLILGTAQLRAADVAGWDAPDVTHLWRHSISGDRPILLVRCVNMEDLGFVRQCLRAQEYLRIKGLAIDVVILNERRHSYLQDLQQAIQRTVADFRGGEIEGELRGEIFVLATEAISEAERQLLLSLARVVLNPSQGSLRELLSRPALTRSSGPPPRPAVPTPLLPPPVAATPRKTRLEYFNGWGGFEGDTGEYRIVLTPAMPATPAPWSNVIANEGFGTLVTERGSMCSWAMNSRENQLTPWSNDAVADPSGECFYLLDEEGELWSPAPQPVRRTEARYEIRHGQGYSRFDASVRGIASQMTVFVAPRDPVKLCHLHLRNTLPVRRRLLVVSYVEWSLGAARAAINHNVLTERDETGAQFARNPPLIDFGDRVAFCDFGGRQRFTCASRHEFLGRNGSTELPAGLRMPARWSENVRPGTDPCCAFAFEVELAPQSADEVTFVLGQAADRTQARDLVLKYRAASAADVLREVRARWDGLLDKVRIRTPDRALDLIFNRWLLYQTTACRLWGRAGFYQAGGAYGFRDQLQDVMALLLNAPQQARAQLLRAAARQFIEGDVQHWWHPPSGRGVRTHISDDLLFLPHMASLYVQVTGDRAVLDERVPFIEGPPLPRTQEDAHYVPAVSATEASLYEHCARALERSLATGAHGLPLMGGGDWNDGMNRVGHEGRGESVWLAWFLIATLRDFAVIARERGEPERAARWRDHGAALAAACEREAWDGAWYRRAFFDDGTPLGSAMNQECRIDSLAQSWAVLGGAADPQRARTAMKSVEQYLVQADKGLVLLFTPPFDTAPEDPGYIKGYVPGLRENGGQYTHASVWVLMAQARLGNATEVSRLLQMLNPAHRTASTEGARIYRVEPYVLAADVYAGKGIAGRGGWTWYTGAAGWMYRAILEAVLGVKVRGGELWLEPCMPAQWQGFEVELDLPGTYYLVRVRRGAAQRLLDGEPFTGRAFPLVRDERRHTIELFVEEALLVQGRALREARGE